MAENSLMQRFEQYQPPKAAVVWSFAIGAVLTMIIGFNLGGWVTGGASQELTQTAVGEARAELAAGVCVERFTNAANASAQFASLRSTDSWKQDDFIEKGSWVTLAGMDEPIAGAADLCAERLLEMQQPPKTEA